MYINEWESNTFKTLKKLVSQLKIEKDISMRKRRHDREKKTIICLDGAMVFAVTLFLMGNFINYSFIGCSPNRFYRKENVEGDKCHIKFFF